MIDNIPALLSLLKWLKMPTGIRILDLEVRILILSVGPDHSMTCLRVFFPSLFNLVVYMTRAAHLPPLKLKGLTESRRKSIANATSQNLKFAQGWLHGCMRV